MPSLDFIDISHWQNDAGPINWQQVRSSGIVGVIIKATEDTGYVDPKYLTNRANALGVGLLVATYHFLRHGNISKQMQHYVNTVKPQIGERMVIDYEHDACTIDDLVQAVSALQVERVEISVYGASKLTDDVKRGGNPAILKSTSLWAARYSSSEPVVATGVWPTYTAWQYSQSGKVPGIAGNVDLNMFNGSRENCAKWFGPVVPVPEPQPEPEPEPEPEPTPDKEVLVALTVPAGVNVTVTVNGEFLNTPAPSS